MNSYCSLQANNLTGNSFYNKSNLHRAINYADVQHAGQIRKSLDKEPFITHCLNVGNILAKTHSSENAIVAGILHDTIEDTTVTKNDLIKVFGQKIAELVDFVTEHNPSDDWMERCKDYIDNLKKAPQEALCVSAADKIDNMNSMADSISREYNIFKNMQGTPEMQLKKFTGVLEVIKGKIPKDLETMYIASLENFIKTLSKFKYLK